MTENFLMVVPEGWIALDTTNLFGSGSYDPSTVQLYISEGALWEIDNILEATGMQQVGMITAAAKLFIDDTTNIHFWIKLTPDPAYTP